MLPLTAEKARIFRIAHVDNLPWILKHGIHCRSSAVFDPNYRGIGLPDLIDQRSRRQVPIPPGGTLSDYVPFYFTSRSPMLLNIKTGRNVPAVPMRDIVVMTTSLHRLAGAGLPFVFTDRHAYLVTARFSHDLADLGWIDWSILARSDFRRDPNDLGKMERYQAEALVSRALPVSALTGVICYDAERASAVERDVAAAGHALPVVARPEFFF